MAFRLSTRGRRVRVHRYCRPAAFERRGPLFWTHASVDLRRYSSWVFTYEELRAVLPETNVLFTEPRHMRQYVWAQIKPRSMTQALEVVFSEVDDSQAGEHLFTRVPTPERVEELRSEGFLLTFHDVQEYKARAQAARAADRINREALDALWERQNRGATDEE